MKRLLLALSLLSLAIPVAASEPVDEALLEVVQLPAVSHKPLKDVLHTIAEQAHLRLVFELDAIDHAHIPLDAPVTANIRSLAAGKALDLVLEPCGLTYEAVGKTIVVTTPSDSPDAWKEVSYPVDDLVTEVGTTPKAKPDFDQLIGLIKQTVAVETWSADRDARIRISDDSRHLMINQTEDAHHRIAQLLEQLRSIADAGAPKEAARRQISIDSHNEPLSAVLRQISDVCQLNVLLAPECGDPKVDLVANHVTADEALVKLLPSLKLWRGYGHGALIVAPDRELYSVAYCVGDLVKDGADLTKLAQRISNRVLPDSWKQPACGVPSIEPFATNLTLAVSQTQRGHEQVEQFLNELRAAK